MSGIEKVSIHLFNVEFMMLCRRNAAKTKTIGERGSPCLTSLLQWNTFPGIPFNSIEDVLELITIFINCSHFGPKPLYSEK
jgi:hypothetical protein